MEGHYNFAFLHSSVLVCEPLYSGIVLVSYTAIYNYHKLRDLKEKEMHISFYTHIILKFCRLEI